MSGARILAVDDDPAILRVVERALRAAGFAVDTLAAGSEVVARVHATRPDVILLDLILPDADGIDLCRRLAPGPASIIVLSAVGDDRKKVEALDAGADDYLTKPFSIDELLARIRVALRHQARAVDAPLLRAGEIEVDLGARTTRVGGTLVHLTPKEFALLRMLLNNQGKVLTQRMLLAEVWGPEYVDDSHILRTFVHQLRGKLDGGLAGAGSAIVTDPGVGYRLDTPES